MSPLTEIDAAVELLRSHDVDLAVMQCTSSYPCPPEKIGLNMMTFFRDRYGCQAGLSDHSGTIYPSLAAATLGVDVLEVHVTMSREMFGPDVNSSVTTTEMRQLVDGVRFIEKMKSNPVDKEKIFEEATALRDMFTKSVVARMDLPAGTVLRQEHLTVKKPGTGIPASRLAELIGARLTRQIRTDELLQERDLEGFR
jgi:N-acetylneuraminate synthase